MSYFYAARRLSLALYAPVFIVLMAYALRLYALDGQSFWFDEGWSWHLARLPLREMAIVTAGDRSPLLYYTMLHGWMALVGQSEFALRYLSLMADALTVAVVWGLGKRLSRRGWMPMLLYALCPFALWYAQETRMYAQVALFCTTSSYALLRWLDERARRWLIGSALGLALAVHSHYYAVFLLPAQAMIALGYSMARGGLNLRHLWSYGLSALAVIGSVLPWLFYARGGFAYDDGFFFPLNTIDGRMLEWIRAFASGGAGYNLPEWWPIIAAIGVGWAIFATWRNPRHLLSLGLALLPLLIAAIVVRVVYPYRSVFHPRYLIYVAPMLCMWLGSAWPARRAMGRWAWLGCLPLVVLALWLPALRWHYTQPPVIRDDTRGAVRHVVEALEPGDAVVMARDNFAMQYYWPTITAQIGKHTPLLAAPEGLHGVLKDETHLLAQLNATPPKRVRLMLWQDDVVDPQKLVESTLWRNGYQIGEYNFGRIRLPLYQITEPRIQPITGQTHEIQLGGQLTLKASWLRPRVMAGDWFYAVLWWQPTQPLLADYKVFVHVVDANDQVVFQDDRMQLNDLLPMTRWAAGETLRAPHAVVVPATLPAGEYRVFVGVYHPVSGERLQLVDGGDQILLGSVTITAHP